MKFNFGEGRNWFFERRFGLFIHWGLYSVNAWQEQEQFRKALPRKDYTYLIEKFNPVGFNPYAWLDAVLIGNDFGSQTELMLFPELLPFS